MSSDLGQLEVARKNGDERFHQGGRRLDFDLQTFWQWATSDLVSNATRGVLAEYIVARALGIDVDASVREEWAAFELETTSGIKVEVKSAAYVQSWHQNALSRISFRVPATRSWDPATSRLEGSPKRQAHVYVFALLATKDKATVDPMDLQQWRFYVLPTRTLDERERSQHSITLNSLEQLAGGSVSYVELGAAVSEAADREGVHRHS